jgi:hypothetical protein
MVYAPVPCGLKTSFGAVCGLMVRPTLMTEIAGSAMICPLTDRKVLEETT